MDLGLLVRQSIEKAYEEKAKAEALKAKQNKPSKFEVGKTYGTTSACDHNCWFTYTIVKRTEKSVVIRDAFGKERRCMIKIGGYYKHETIYPQGVYSMCPVVNAKDEIVA